LPSNSLLNWSRKRRETEDKLGVVCKEEKGMTNVVRESFGDAWTERKLGEIELVRREALAKG